MTGHRGTILTGETFSPTAEKGTFKFFIQENWTITYFNQKNGREGHDHIDDSYTQRNICPKLGQWLRKYVITVVEHLGDVSHLVHIVLKMATSTHRRWYLQRSRCIKDSLVLTLRTSQEILPQICWASIAKLTIMSGLRNSFTAKSWGTERFSSLGSARKSSDSFNRASSAWE